MFRIFAECDYNVFAFAAIREVQFQCQVMLTNDTRFEAVTTEKDRRTP